jgi:integrase
VIRYRLSIDHLTVQFGHRSILDIKSADLMAFEEARRKASGNRKVSGKRVQISASTIRRDLACLSSVYSYAMAQEWVEVNPVPAFLKSRKSALKEGNARRRYLSHAEEARLIAACLVPTKNGKNHLRQMLHAAVVLAIDTGLRKEELFSLTWRDLQLSPDRSFAKVASGVAKSGKAREVPLFDRGSNVVSGLPVHPTSNFVFWWKDGERFFDLKKAFGEACARARIEDLTWHDLRRTAGTRLLQDHGRSMVEVAKWLGHSNSAVTEKHYAFLGENALDDIVKADRARRADKPSAEIVPLRRKA